MRIRVGHGLAFSGSRGIDVMSSKPSHLNEALKPRLYLSSILIFQPLWRRVWSPVLAPPRHHQTESSLL